MYRLPRYRFIIAILTITVNVLFAAVNINVEAETGFRSGIPAQTDDTLFGNYPVCAIDIEPVWLVHSVDSIRAILNLQCDALKYIGGSGELTAGTGVGIEKRFASHASTVSTEVTCNFLPSVFDPTGLEKYMEYKLKGERTNSGKVPLTGSYTFALQSAIDATRMDFRNRLQLKASFPVFRYIHFYVKTGCLWNLSNTQGAGFLQPMVSGGAAGALDERTTVMAQVFGACSFYHPASVPVLVRAGNSKKGKVKDTLLIDQPLDRKPFTTLYFGVERDLNSELFVHFYYMNTIFSRSRTERLYLSHQVGVCMEWNRESFW